MTGSLIGPRHRHATDIDDLSPGLDDQAARLFGWQRAGWQHETACRNRLFTVPAEQVYRSQVVVVPLAATEETVTRLVVPAPIDDGLVTQAVCCILLGVVVGQCEAISGPVENSVCEGVE